MSENSRPIEGRIVFPDNDDDCELILLFEDEVTKEKSSLIFGLDINDLISKEVSICLGSSDSSDSLDKANKYLSKFKLQLK